MNKIIITIFVTLIGLTSGYFFMISAGYTASFTYDFTTDTIRTLKSLDMLYLWPLVGSIYEIVKLTLTAVPVFIIACFIELYFFRRYATITNWASAVGISIFPGLFGAYPAIYDTRYLDALFVVTIPIIINLLLMNKISNMVKQLAEKEIHE